MIRLETVEDFERVDKALNNPGGKLSEYCVMNYGYCGFCRSIAVFDAVSVCDEDNVTPTVVRCCGCQNQFLPDHRGLSYHYCVEHEWDQPVKQEIFSFRINGYIPESQNEIVREFFSRDNQRKLFNEKLETRIKAFKSEQRVISSKIRRLAKLRS